MTARRSSAAVPIPEELQVGMRRRIRLLRQSRGLAKNEVDVLHSSTVSKIENVDIAQLKLGDIYGLAQVFGVSFKELLDLLAGDEGVLAASDVERQAQRIATFLTNMSESERAMVTDIIQRISRFSLGERAERRFKREAASPQASQDLTRSRVRERLGMLDGG